MVYLLSNIGNLTSANKLKEPSGGSAPAAPETPSSAPSSEPSQTLDVRGLPCPGPVIRLKTVFADAPEGTAVHLLAARGFETDLRNWAKGAGCHVNALRYSGGDLEADVIKGRNAAPTPCSAAAGGGQEQSAAIVLFSNDLDKAMAAMILANGLAAAGMKVDIFFTFWGLAVLRKNPAPALKKDLVSRMFGWMLPKGAARLALSKMNMLGLGSAMMKDVMKRQNVLTLPELIQSAREAGVRFIACDMAMGVMGITREELIEVDEVAGVATFAELAKKSTSTLFI